MKKIILSTRNIWFGDRDASEEIIAIVAYFPGDSTCIFSRRQLEQATDLGYEVYVVAEEFERPEGPEAELFDWLFSWVPRERVFFSDETNAEYNERFTQTWKRAFAYLGVPWPTVDGKPADWPAACDTLSQHGIGDMYDLPDFRAEREQQIEKKREDELETLAEPFDRQLDHERVVMKSPIKRWGHS